MIACVGVFIFCFSVIYFDYIHAVEKNNFIDFDVQTITAGDYTVEFDFPIESYQYFKDVYYNKDSPMSEAAQFKLLVQHELEERLTLSPSMGYDDEEIVEAADSMADPSMVKGGNKSRY